MRYSQHFNQRTGASGHLWQGRFYSCVLDELYLYSAVRYVENNPVRAKIVAKPHDYKWSSARSHIYKETDTVQSGDCYLTKQVQDWAGYLEEREDNTVIDTIRSSTRTGRPCGDEGFHKENRRVNRKETKDSAEGKAEKEINGRCPPILRPKSFVKGDK